MQPEQKPDEQQATPQAGWVFTPGESPSQAATQTEVHDTVSSPPAVSDAPTAMTSDLPYDASGESISWTASEYVEHQKNSAWFMAVGATGAIVGAAVYFFTGDYVSTAMVMIAVVIFAVFAGRSPKTLTYVLDNTGLRIGNKTYGYHLFKSFAVVEDDHLHSILLLPMQRFMPSLTIYYAPEDEEHIVDALSDYLPVEQHKRDVVDRFLQRIRF